MIRNYTTGKTKFVQIRITAPDGRFDKVIKGGIDLKTALFECKKYPKSFILDILDSKESLEDKK